jgi:hypothetical protein
MRLSVLDDPGRGSYIDEAQARGLLREACGEVIPAINAVPGECGAG